jgi:hypothetical protein
MTDLYHRYHTYVKTILESNNLQGFKRHPDYTYMLEHVSQQQGTEYLTQIQKNTELSIEKIQEFCALNDRTGDPIRYSYGIVECSPTSLRYIYHAHLILSHMRSLGLSSQSIVEVGGGYGGLCLALHYFAPLYSISIQSYRIIDLPNALELQKLYLGPLTQTVPHVEFVSAHTYGSPITEQNLFIVSCYCFSEIEYIHQKYYTEQLMPKVSHGFMAWNHIPVYNFGFELRVEEEVPRTGSMNKYVYF